MHDLRRARDDAHQLHLHPQRSLLPVGRVLHRVDRVWRGRLHGTVGRESRQHLNDQSDHVHRLQRRLHRAHLLRLHELQALAAGGSGEGQPVQPGPADRPGRRLDDTRPDGAPAGQHLHLPRVLQDGLSGDLHRRHARYVPVACFAVHLRARYLHQRSARARRGRERERHAGEGAEQASAALRDPASPSSLLHRERGQVAPGQPGYEHGGIRGA